MRADDEHDLVRRAREGDADAWAALLERADPAARARVERGLRPALRRKIAADDVLQEARLVAFRRLAGFEDRGDGAFSAWFSRIAELKLREALRRFVATAKRGGVREVSRGARPETARLAGRGPTPSEAASAGELRERTLRAVERLPPDYRLVLRLVQSERHTLGDAAVRMGRSKEAVKKLYARALESLAASLGLESGANPRRRRPRAPGTAIDAATEP